MLLDVVLLAEVNTGLKISSNSPHHRYIGGLTCAFLIISRTIRPVLLRPILVSISFFPAFAHWSSSGGIGSALVWAGLVDILELECESDLLKNGIAMWVEMLMVNETLMSYLMHVEGMFASGWYRSHIGSLNAHMTTSEVTPYAGLGITLDSEADGIW